MNPTKRLFEMVAARYPVVLLLGEDERRMDIACGRIAEKLDRPLLLWSCCTGYCDIDGNPTNDAALEPEAALDFIAGQWNGAGMFLLHDFTPYIDPQNGGATIDVQRRIKELSMLFDGLPPDGVRTLLLTGPAGFKLPAGLDSTVAVLRWPLPDKEEISTTVQAISKSAEVELDEAALEAIIRAGQGLPMTEFANCLGLSLRSGGGKKFDLQRITEGKKSAIERSGVLSWKEPPAGGLAWVGGMEELKPWLKQRARAFTQAARDFGLPIPRGTLTVGIPGGGKSLVTMAAAAEWGMPVVRLGEIMGSLLGESESNMDKALAVAEAAAPCILQIDEIEKFFSGLESSGQTDGGVKAGLFGKFLTWMQEKEAPVFVAATANDVSALPPELLRKGRFDELWFVDLPHGVERLAILKVHLSRRGRGELFTDAQLDRVVQETAGFSGAELESLIVDAMFAAFDAEREVQVEDIIEAAKRCVPLSATAPEKIKALQEWGAKRARPASRPPEKKAGRSDSTSRFSGLGN